MKSAFREWFIATTPFTLLLMAGFIVLTWPDRKGWFWNFVGLCYVTGYTVEWIGVNTGYLFGEYNYGSPMGWQLGNIPLMIGVQWFVTIWSLGHLTNWFAKICKIEVSATFTGRAGFVIFAALLTTAFDVILEPAAINLGYWQWQTGNQVPLFNYVCWFCVSCFLFIPFISKKELHSNLHPFAIALAFIQLLFFLIMG
jgi:putative membrane protein